MQPVGLAVVGALGAVEGAAAIARHRDRSRLYAQAVARASRLSRPLVVIGDPDAGAHTSLYRAYGCGDTCVDLAGCPGCPVAISADVTQPLPFADDSAVVFVSCVLEYVSDASLAWQQILRVAGTPENIFVATVQPWTATAVFYPGARRTVEVRDGALTTEALSPARKAATVAAIGGLIAWALWPRARG